MTVLFQEDVARVAHDLGLNPEFLCFLGRSGACDAFLSAYKRAVSCALHPDLHGSDATGKACEARLKRFNGAFDALANSDIRVREWLSLSTDTRESALLSELRRRNRELQQLREELASERRGNTRRWDNISAR